MHVLVTQYPKVGFDVKVVVGKILIFESVYSYYSLPDFVINIHILSYDMDLWVAFSI